LLIGGSDGLSHCVNAGRAKPRQQGTKNGSRRFGIANRAVTVKDVDS
jgi:hypothetical protein